MRKWITRYGYEETGNPEMDKQVPNYYWNVTRTTTISEAPAVRTGGPQPWTPVVTMTWERPLTPYPHGISYSFRAMKFKGKTWALWVWPDN